MFSVLFALALAAQAPATPSVEATPPSTTADPTAVVAPEPAAATPAPAPAATAAPQPDPTPQGWSGPATVAVQALAGAGGCCVGGCVGGCIALPLAFIPLVGPIAANVIAGVLVGGAEVVVGDAVGQSRSALLWPMIASAGIFVAGGVASGVAAAALGLASTSIVNDIAAGRIPPVLFIPAGINVVTIVAGLAVPIAVYHMTAVPKEPGDTGGFGMPGFTSPADPTGTRASKAAQTSSTTASPTTTTPPTTTPTAAPAGEAVPY